MEIQFYHLLTQPIEVALPRLMAKAYEAGLPSLIKCRDAMQVKRFDEKLWTYDPDSFLPHGGANEAQAEQQPILLSTELSRANAASFVIITDGTRPEAEVLEGVTRLADMFDGGDDSAVKAARERWKYYKEQGYALSYYRQQENGGWKKEA
mgnify:CR=1 FL=1